MSGWILAYIASTAFTAAVSSAQIHNGCTEQNPLASSHYLGNVAFKGATATGLGIGLRFTLKRSPKTGRVLFGSAIGMNLAVGIHDAMQHCGGR